ncbi:MAG: hypothetical protein GQ574_06780 [Crocinitomix sp.]|nr:hypothetical protein [Crocinitomix sp.]
MKALFIFLFLTSAAFAQENPWENKGKVNPWGNQKKEVEKKDSVKTTDKQDSVLVTKNQPVKDSVKTITTQPTKDSSSVTVVEFEVNQPVQSEWALIEAAQEQVSHEYKSGNDFAFGFTTGLFLNVFGIVPDIPYVLIDSKQENRIQSEINTDSTYVSVNDEKLRTKTKNTVKNKKFFATAGGTALGSLVQIFAFVVILSAF